MFSEIYAQVTVGNISEQRVFEICIFFMGIRKPEKKLKT